MNRMMALLLLLMAGVACRETPQDDPRAAASLPAAGNAGVRYAPRSDSDATAPARNGPDGVMGRQDGHDQDADAEHEARLAKARETLDAEKNRCEMQSGDQRQACIDAAQATYDAALAEADRRRNDYGADVDPRPAL